MVKQIQNCREKIFSSVQKKQQKTFFFAFFFLNKEKQQLDLFVTLPAPFVLFPKK